MTPPASHWPQAFSLLDQALELPEDARLAWALALDARTFPAKALVIDLLRQRAIPEQFLSTLPALTSPLAAHSTTPNTPANGPSDPSLVAGTLVGPYRLLVEIGVGGMGSVWLAERADDGVKRSVALKLPRLFLLAGFAERMTRERDILASLTHPHIARLYDAGVDTDGRPYLALEYVAGDAIDLYAERRALSIRDRLKLLLQVGSAVAYAHTQLVVHRDLKPSNILVTDEGEVRLLDFGIAKLIEPESADSEAWTALTKVGERALTLDYASPEQIRGESIGTASDVYSLAVVAFELLAEVRPFKVAQSGKYRSGPLEQAILHLDAPLASTVALDPLVKKELKGDLDAILNKALKKSPADRYASIEAFMQDIRHYLAGEPVLAQPDRLSYRTHKFIARNKFFVAAATVAALAVIGGSSLALWHAKQSARAEARSGAVTQFLVRSLRDHSAESSPGLTPSPVTGRLVNSAAQIETVFADDPVLQQQLYAAVAPIFADLGLTQLAIKYGTRNLEYKAAQGDSDLRALADAALPVARGLTREGDVPAADRVLRRSFTASTQLCSTITSCIVYVEIAIRQQKIDEAARQLAHLVAMVEANPEIDVGLKIDAEALKGRVAIFRRADNALTFFERALAWSIAAEGEHSLRSAALRRSYGARLIESWNRPEGWEQMEKAVASFRRIGGEYDLNAAEVELEFGYSLAQDSLARRAEGFARIARARDVFERTQFGGRAERLARVSLYQALIAKHAGDLESATTQLALIAGDPAKMVAGDTLTVRRFGYREYQDVLSQRGEKDSTRQALRALLAAMAPTDSRRNYNILLVEMALVRAEMLAGDYDVAQSLLKDSLAFAPAQFERFPTLPDRARFLRAQIQIERGEFLPARAEFALALAELAKQPDTNRADREEAIVYTGLGEAQCGLGERAEGLANLRLGESKLAARHHPASPVLARARAVAGLCAAAAGERDLAQSWLRQAETALKTKNNVSTYYSGKALQLKTLLAK